MDETQVAPSPAFEVLSARERFLQPEFQSVGQRCGLALCLSHLRWDFVYQRPQHLMSRLSTQLPVIYFEEPKPTDAAPWLEQRRPLTNLTIAVPHLPAAECAAGDPSGIARQRSMLDALLAEHQVSRPLLWYYTPMALAYSAHLDAALVVYDCMDELSGFRFAPAALADREQQLLTASDVVFTGGRSLYEAKRQRHANVHAFPSGVDLAHFSRARAGLAEPADQHRLARPRIGYYGVIDERLDYDLIAAAARLRPNYQWIFVGPLAKIAEADLPRAPNLHYLGRKAYEALPEYLGGWDVAMMPFALNDATTYISPTKTPEYLAGGRPVISTAVADVVRGYADSGLVSIAGDAQAFVAAADAWIEQPLAAQDFTRRAEPLLAPMSWDGVFSGMQRQMIRAIQSLDHAAGVRPVAVTAGAAS
jgi:glycosyltransferase involved in cell wall biosynthesis